MWKCKKCGGKIQGYYTGFIDIDEYGVPIDSKRENEEIVRYVCYCYDYKEEFDEKKAEWVEEEDD